MNTEQHEALDEVIIKLRAGRMRRRTFLERAAALGLTGSAALSLLAACGGTPNSGGSSSGPITLTWTSERNTAAIPAYTQFVDSYNKTNKDNIHVVYHAGPTSDQLRTNIVTMLRARNASSDIFSMDIIWPAEFSSNQWTVPLDDKWPASERAKYLPGPIQGCTSNGKIWAAPLRTDVGLIYYRTDVISTPPKTWDELTNMAQQAQSQKKSQYGYVWEAAQEEGMVCNFVEALYCYGAAVLDPKDSTKVVVNSPEALQALTKLVSTVGTLAPPAVVTYTSDNVMSAWQNGDSSMMRQWPFAYAQANDPKNSKVAGKFDVTPMPAGGSNTQGHSTVGGWNLGINAFSNSDKQAAAWKFIQYMISPGTQKQFAMQTSLAATYAAVYDDPEVLAKMPLFGKLKAVVQNAVPRPVSKFYPDITNSMQQHVHAALTKQVTPTQALSALQSDLEKIVAR